jgi:hypothetical protein
LDLALVQDFSVCSWLQLWPKALELAQGFSLGKKVLNIFSKTVSTV